MTFMFVSTTCIAGIIILLDASSIRGGGGGGVLLIICRSLNLISFLFLLIFTGESKLTPTPLINKTPLHERSQLFFTNREL